MLKSKIISKVCKEIPSYYESDTSRFLSLYHKEIWFDGGFKTDCSLNEKCKFYQSATLFVEFIKTIIQESEEKAIYIGTFLKKTKNSEDWSNLKEYDCYMNLFDFISDNTIKKFKPFEENDNIIDFVVENGLRYLTKTCFYLPNSKVIIKPECHHRLEIFCSNYNSFIKTTLRLLKQPRFTSLELYDYDGEFHKISIK